MKLCLSSNHNVMRCLAGYGKSVQVFFKVRHLLRVPERCLVGEMKVTFTGTAYTDMHASKHSYT